MGRELLYRGTWTLVAEVPYNANLLVKLYQFLEDNFVLADRRERGSFLGEMWVAAHLPPAASWPRPARQSETGGEAAGTPQLGI